MGAYDEQVAKGQQWGQLFDLIGPGGAGSLALSRMESMRRQQGYGQYPGAAKGKYVNSPTLMMVGEGGAGEVVIPTERIRKGLPINAGVARELGSIGVPGFVTGGLAAFRGGGDQLLEGGMGDIKQSLSGRFKSFAGKKWGSYAKGVSDRFGSDDIGGFGGMAKAGASNPPNRKAKK